MTYQVINPFIQFVDPKNGNPLSAGSVYFGRKDSDPKNQPANRINVYAVQDNGTEVLLAQPITLNGAGQPQVSGSVKSIRVDLYAEEGVYALQLFGKNGSQKGYNPRTSVFVDVAALGAVDSSVLIGGVPAGIIASRFVDPRTFGAKGDGTTDDTAAIVAADNYAASVRTRLIFVTGVYKATDSITFKSEVEMADGAILSCSNANKYFIFSRGFIAGLNPCIDTDAFVQFVNIEQIYPQWFGALGNAVFTTGTIAAGSTALTVNNGITAGTYPIKDGDQVHIMGADTGGGVLSATVVSGGGTANLVLSKVAVLAVNSRTVATKNDTLALKRFFAAVKAGGSTALTGTSQPSTNGCTKLYVPAGIYCSFDTITAYSACVVEGEFANTIGGARIVQCNRDKPLINVVADNFDKNGGSTNGGNGNNIFRNIGFSGAEINDSQPNAPVMNFDYAWNLHADTELDHCLFQNTAGACVGGGFTTTGSIVAGSSTLTLADGTRFRSGNFGGGKITVVGAGIAGANLNAYIVSGGGTNTVTLSVPASTTVAGATVFPQNDSYGLKVNDCEMDVCRAGFDFKGNSSGSLVITNLLAFWSIRGVIRIFSVSPWEVIVSDSYFDGCGNPFDNTDTSWRNAIVVESEYEGSLFIDSCTFDKSESFGGRIAYKGENLTIRNSKITDSDSGFLVKFLQAEAKEVILQNNSFSSAAIGDYTNSRMITLPYASSSLIKINGNTFENLNATAFSNFIQSDNLLNVCDISGNTFSGPATDAVNPNISQGSNTIALNRGLNATQRYGVAIPAFGQWKVGDIVWNSSPVSGGTIGWVCTVAGSPGTWKTFGAIA